MEPDQAHTTVTALGPSRLYRELVYRPGGPLSSWIDANFLVLAHPGEPPSTRPAAGDLLVRVRLGEPGPGYVALLSDSTLTPYHELDASQVTEREGPGIYATVIENGTFPRSANHRYARLIVDASGLTPPGQVLLRSKRSLEVDLDPAEVARDADEWGPFWPAPGVVVDATAAVPPFSSSERSNVLLPLLTPSETAKAITWTTGNHGARSGVTATDLRGALASYVDESAVRSAILAFNASHPSGAIGLGAAPADAVLVESVHQFQLKCYSDAFEHDGKAGESTLDSLGLITRTGKAFKGADRANPRAQHRLNERRAEVDGSEFTAANWFNHMIDPSFLGQRSKRGTGMHVVLVRKLRQAERHLLTLPAYRDMTPVALGRSLGISEKHGGARPDKTTSGSMHTFGLAIDIAYTANPWIRRAASWQALRRAVLLVSGENLRAASAPAFWHELGSDPARSTEDLWAALRQKHDELREYFRLASDQAALETILRTHWAAWTAGVFRPRQAVAQAAPSWQTQMRQDLKALNGGDFKDHDPPTNGFLHLPRDLVVALRDHACLAWGAVDIGPGADGSGDMMHFDARLDGVGAALARGVNYAPTTGHPCLRRQAATSESLTTGVSSVDELAEGSPVIDVDVSGFPADVPDEPASLAADRQGSDQPTALAALQDALATAMLVGEQAATLAEHQALARNIDQIFGHIDRARRDGLLSPDEAGELNRAALRGLVRKLRPGEEPPANEPGVPELLDWGRQEAEISLAAEWPAEDAETLGSIDWTCDQDKVGGTTIRRILVHCLRSGNQAAFFPGEEQKTDDSAKGMAVALLPAGLDPTKDKEVDVLLHFHGWSFRSSDPFAGWRQRKRDGKVRDVDQDHLEQQMQPAIDDLRDPQILGILPQGVGKSDFGNLPAFAYVREVLGKLWSEKKLHGQVRKCRLLLSAHSGGGGTQVIPLMRDLKAETSDRSRLPKQDGSDTNRQEPVGLIALFDAINGPGELADVKAWVDRQVDRLVPILSTAPDAAKEQELAATPKLRAYFSKDARYPMRYKELHCHICEKLTAVPTGPWRQRVADLFRVISVTGAGHEEVVSGPVGTPPAVGPFANALRAVRYPALDQADGLLCATCPPPSTRGPSRRRPT